MLCAKQGIANIRNQRKMPSHFPRLLLLLSILSLNISSALPTGRIVITFSTYDACNRWNDAASAVPKISSMCATLGKCYGRRLVLDVSQCTELKNSDLPSSSLKAWAEQTFPGSTVSTVERDLTMTATQVVEAAVTAADSSGGGKLFSSSLSYQIEAATRSYASIPGVDVASIDAYNKNQAMLVSAAAQPSTQQLLLPSTLQNPYKLHQWNLQMVGAASRWQAAFDGSGATIAVLDSGVAASAIPVFTTGSLVQGYDFVSDAAISMDGNGRDANPLDPGDNSDALQACADQHPGRSSWHGTRVASIVGGKNLLSSDFSGIAYDAKILSTRVLGRCKTGYSSDVADALIWSVGGEINGIATNQNPASIVIMSFGGKGACPSFLQTAVDLAVNTHNAKLYAAAGNDPTADASEYFPANCQGVVSVGALDRQRNPASYTSKNAQLLLPGGGLLDYPVPCVGPYFTIERCVGTSFAVPHAGGLAALQGDLSAFSNDNVALFWNVTARQLLPPSSSLALVFGKDLDPCYATGWCNLPFYDTSGSVQVGPYGSWVTYIWHLYVQNAQVAVTVSSDVETPYDQIRVYIDNSNLESVVSLTGQQTDVQFSSKLGYIQLWFSSIGSGWNADTTISFTWTATCNPGFVEVNSRCVLDEANAAATAQLANECYNNMHIYPPPSMWKFIAEICPWPLTEECENGLKHKNISGSLYGNGVYDIDWSGFNPGWVMPDALFNGIENQMWGAIFTPTAYSKVTGAFVGTFVPFSGSGAYSSYQGDWVKLTMPVSIYLSHIKIHILGWFKNTAPTSYRLYASNDNEASWVLLIEKTSVNYEGTVHTAYAPQSSWLASYNKFVLIVASINGGSAPWADGDRLEFEEMQLFGSEVTPSCGGTGTYKYVAATSSCVQCSNADTDPQCSKRYIDPTTSTCSACGTATLSSTYDAPCQTCSEMYIPDSTPGTCRYCPSSFTKGDTNCAFGPDAISYDSNGQVSWLGLLGDSMDVSWTIKVDHASSIQLALSQRTERDYDFVYIRLTEGSTSWDHQTSGFVANQTFLSTNGYIEIRMTNDNTVSWTNPISFYWTTQCATGYTEVNKRCQARPRPSFSGGRYSSTIRSRLYPAATDPNIFTDECLCVLCVLLLLCVTPPLPFHIPLHAHVHAHRTRHNTHFPPKTKQPSAPTDSWTLARPAMTATSSVATAAAAPAPSRAPPPSSASTSPRQDPPSAALH